MKRKIGSSKSSVKLVNCAIDAKDLDVGDVVAIEWNDVHAYERIEISEINELEEPEATLCWCVVVRKTKRYLFIASELGDKDSDGAWIEAIPFKIINKLKLLDKIIINWN